jgi:3-methylfumaryl-CoA hydratase
LVCAGTNHQASKAEKNVSTSSSKPFHEWIGRQTRSEDIITERLDASFRAIFGPHLAATRQGEAPAGIHWCLSPAIAAMDKLGGDGHPLKNKDVPPVPLPRRMWAGGVVENIAPLSVGSQVTRVSTIVDVAHKEGRTGELWFVTVDHEYRTGHEVAIRDRQNIVYREAAKPGLERTREAPKEAARPISTSWTVPTSPVFLFRYSAITFNGHRIHYDEPYATGVEGYDGLVVHGPIQATLLLNLAASQLGRAPARFVYRGTAPAIAGGELLVCRGAGDEANKFWTQSPSGRIHMEAGVEAA